MRIYRRDGVHARRQARPGGLPWGRAASAEAGRHRWVPGRPRGYAPSLVGAVRGDGTATVERRAGGVDAQGPGGASRSRAAWWSAQKRERGAGRLVQGARRRWRGGSATWPCARAEGTEGGWPALGGAGRLQRFFFVKLN